MSTPRRAAVLGSPIAHSLSPVLHQAGYAAADLADWEYLRLECGAEELPEVVGQAGPEYAGFSVTMPGKFAALEYATEATERARAIGAANTLVRVDGGWRADNTDVEGILGALGELGVRSPKRALLVGSGGTARPALYALAQRGVQRVDVLNRSDRLAELRPLTAGTSCEVVGHVLGDESVNIADLARGAEVIVSTVPSAAIADYVQDLAHSRVLDVIYDPWPTALCTQAAANGFRTVGGHVMLAHQAYSQFEQFTGVSAPRTAMRRALEEHIG
ncbi:MULTISPECIES: shikimate dehydrogenase [unclassified Corynebacterium]|uniref:shikimate dehydrogenase n=1 Tax=unclassified Corynebacterium TaxID=2624378 RepID=UPI0029CA4ACD|nr:MULTISPECIES: shikimate dehydrogenase [unclassified Corynebacterium]WPF65170.1 shikimate dehydrogenase [Corynebacterium sp. 22KM0430]WPF67666.1 shikimate dehydrogenase [Corynebacterium sp. 21KM1197]